MSDPMPRPFWVGATLFILALALCVVFVLLGNWQIRRLAWKEQLIEIVDARVDAALVAPPTGPITFEDHAYLRVSATGTLKTETFFLVKAVTDLGPGFWVMTPLVTPTQTLWVNRGFVPGDKAKPDDWDIHNGPVEITGLLRLSEPDGTFLESNDPANNYWVSRDLAAMNAAAGINANDQFFIDAAGGDATIWPRAGLTKTSFRNTHLSYALTWYAMALLLAGAVIYLVWRR